jgi:hypothetical protein
VHISYSILGFTAINAALMDRAVSDENSSRRNFIRLPAEGLGGEWAYLKGSQILTKFRKKLLINAGYTRFWRTARKIELQANKYRARRCFMGSLLKKIVIFASTATTRSY